MSGINPAADALPEIATYTRDNLTQAIPSLDQDTLKEMEELDPDSTGRLQGYRAYREWYDGEHSASLSDRQQELLEGSGIPFSDNFTDMVVDSVSNRLELLGVSAMPEVESFDDATLEIMKASRIDILSSRVHHNAIKLGDAFIIADFNQTKNEVMLTYNRPDIIRVEYDDDNGYEMEWVVKLWTTDKVSPFNPLGDDIQRMNVYHTDRIEKYYRPDGGGDWLPFMDDVDLLWPVLWIDESTGEGLGIPVFHFRNNTIDSDYGVSEIKKTIPQQALLNKFILDLDLVMDKQGYPQRWGTGIDDVDGGESSFGSEPGDLWTTANEGAKFGQFDSADVNGALSVISMMIDHISSSNSTPIHSLMGGANDSGESLKMRDSGLSDKAAKKMLYFGNVWEDVFRYAHKLRNLRAEGKVAVLLDGQPAIELQSNWRDTTPRNEKTLVEVLRILVGELGASKRYALTKYGVENVDSVLREAEDEKEIDSERSLRAITRGSDFSE